MGGRTRRTGRLAPTPSGRLHLGNALSFGVAWLSARQAGAHLVLRIEDVDTTRARPALEAAIRDDLRWLGLSWDEETPRQSQRHYGPWLDRLDTYRCICTRKLLAQRPCPCGEADHPDGAVRWRRPDGAVAFLDRRWGLQLVDPSEHGDPVLVRRDGVANYLLAVVVDDLRDGVTEVVRGADLLPFTAIQVRLWEALGAVPPTWLHAPLLLGPDGRKLSKSHQSTEVAALRAGGWTPQAVWRLLLPFVGIRGVETLAEAVPHFAPTAGEQGPIVLDTAD